MSANINEKIMDSKDSIKSIVINDEGSTVQVSEQSGIFHSWWSKWMGSVYADSDPHNLSPGKKNSIIFFVAVNALIGPAGTFIYMPGINNVMDDMNTSVTGANATVAVYAVFLGVAPLFWAAMSDSYGRKPVYAISLVIFIIGAIVSTFSNNVGTLIVLRAFMAFGGGAGQTLGAGVIADTFHVSERGKAYGMFNVGPLCGPIIGPTIGGALCEFLGWRSTLYFLAILGGLLLIAELFLLPETLRLEKLESKLEKENNRRLRALKNFKAVFVPMIVMLGDPTVLIITAYNTIVFSCMFFVNPTITYIFQTVYNYNSWQVGLCYLLVGFGLMAGSLMSGRYSDHVLRQLSAANGGKENIYPEVRLRAGFPAFFLLPTGLFIYGWTSEKAVGVYAPFIGLFIFACGQMWGTTPSSVYLVDSKPGRSASALAINNFVRYIVAAIIGIFSTSFVRALGPGILFTIIASINVANMGLSLLVYVYGKEWRTNFEERSGTSPIIKQNK